MKREYRIIFRDAAYIVQFRNKHWFSWWQEASEFRGSGSGTNYFHSVEQAEAFAHVHAARPRKPFIKSLGVLP